MDSKKNKTILITGGTSGIGLATAKIFVKNGARVVIAGRSNERGAAALKEFSAEEICRVKFLPTDVADVASCDKLVYEAARIFDGKAQLDALINSAGEYVEGAIGDVTEEMFYKITDVNVKGTFFMCRAALPYLEKNGGAIINVASDAGLRGNYFCSLYCAAKGAVVAFTRALALEEARFNVRVNCVAPGDIMTPMTEKQLQQSADYNAALKEMASVYPLGRIGTAAEAAAAIAFLASDSASFITGAILSVDGGLTA